MNIRDLYGSRWAIAFVYVAVACLTLSYYNWLARAAGDRYPWGQDLAQFYGYLGRAFAQGQLHLPVAPSKELLALKDPWDPALNGDLKLHDAALYKGRYYLYHGAGPAVVLFAPWRIVTGHDLPENFGVMLLCFLAYLFLSGSLVLLLRQANAMPGPGMLGLMLFVLAVGTGVPYLLVRAIFYEVAIAGGFFGSAGSLFFLVRGLQGRSPLWFLLSGLMTGVALASRPHVGLATGLCALLILLWHKHWRRAIVFALPAVLSGVAVLAYNYARFDDAFEFGLRYLLTGERNQQRLNLSADNLYPGAYYTLFYPPVVSAVFPFVHLSIRLPPLTESLPKDYFLEATAGALMLSPVLLALLLLPVLRRSLSAAAVLLGVLGAAVGAFLFVIITGFTTHRYQIDFVPLMLVAALVCMALTIRRWRGGRRALVLVVSSALCLWAIFTNAALGMTGPYDEILQQRPVRWLRIACRFSFFDEHKPLLNPSVALAAQVKFQKHGAGLLEPLFILGRNAYRWMLYAEHTSTGISLISLSNTSSAKSEIRLEPGQEFTIRAEYDPESKAMTALVNDKAVIRHQLEGLVSARSQIQLGQNHTIPFFTYPEFTGTMDMIEGRIEPAVPAR